MKMLRNEIIKNETVRKGAEHIWFAKLKYRWLELTMLLFSMFMLLVLWSKQINAASNSYDIPEMKKEIDLSKYNVRWGNQNKVVIVRDVFLGRQTNKVVGRCWLRLGLAREKGTDNYILLMREDMTPLRFTRTVTTSYGSSQTVVKYGLSEYLSVRTILPVLHYASPQTSSKNNKVINLSISLSATPFSFSYGGDESLNIISRSSYDSNANLFDVTYDYEPNFFAFARTYLSTPSSQYGVAYFTQKSPYWLADGTISFVMDYDVRFGACDSPNGGGVDWGSGCVMKTTQQEIVSFTVPKK